MWNQTQKMYMYAKIALLSLNVFRNICCAICKPRHQKTRWVAPTMKRPPTEY